MSPHTFPTSPAREGEQRKFINPTSGWVGANVFGPDGKPTSIPVEPGGEVWLTEPEERMTAEAPRLPQDNPFVKEWEEGVEFDPVTGEATRTVTRHGVLVLADEPARPIASDRFVPARAATPEPEEEAAAEEKPEEITGAPPVPEQPPVEGQPSPDEVVGTPEAVAANDEALSSRKPTREQPVKAKSGAISTE